MTVAKLELVAVRGVGTAEERVMMRALEDVDLGDYIVTDSTYRKDGVVSNKARHVYEFAKKRIAAGEWIALRSRKGTYNVTTLDDDRTPLHLFYWGLDYRIWNEDGDNAWLLLAPQVARQSKRVAPAK